MSEQSVAKEECNDTKEFRDILKSYLLEDSSILDKQFTFEGVVNAKLLRLEDDLLDDIPETYEANTLKEQLCLEYVSQFCGHFEQMYPSRKSLYMCPLNERGIKKFVCTTIRPTLLPYAELYEWITLASFISGMIQYEPLVNARLPPRILPSPTFNLKYKVGDCYELATLLVSFLIGAGYDAYVVRGVAQKHICLRNQSGNPLPNLAIDEHLGSSKDLTELKIASIIDGTAEFLCEKGKTFTEEQRVIRRKDVADSHETKSGDEDSGDPLLMQREHAWVLVRAGKRDVEKHFFIEPSIGRSYPIENAPYYTIESIWNDKNYWVNMQMEHVATTLYELTKVKDWEYVFLSASNFDLGKDDISRQDRSDISNSEAKEVESVIPASGSANVDNNTDIVFLNVPYSWVQPLVIDRKAHNTKFVTDFRNITLFDHAKLEEFTENSHEQGIVTRLSIYHDATCYLAYEIREYFKNRKDKLLLRRRFLLENRYEEFFSPARPDALKARLEWTGFRREMYFYRKSRMDGLVQRVELFQKKYIESYEQRDDYLIRRTAKFAKENEKVDWKNPYILTEGSSGELFITKMVEKYARNTDIEASQDIRKRVFNVQKGIITVLYHYRDGKITAGSRTYFKNPTLPVEVVLADPTDKRPKASILESESASQIVKEKECFIAVRQSALDSQEMIKIRKKEEVEITLEMDVFSKVYSDQSSQMNEDTNEAENDTMHEVDYLSPFLQGVSFTERGLSKETAQSVRDMCLRNLKERLLERANIIQTRIDHENMQLAKRQAAFQRSQRDQDENKDEEYKRYCTETMFRIQILEQRLTKHEETALHKYAEMDRRLHNDTRLYGSDN
uniref:Dynein regulatory complex subunit 7 n=1 Tax=Albugo laibachii Nc14 TaxID=890382 RepID=F0WS01_9STRA|nr:conserved hypothetical protein [Albugo laibachii Nc14]|eukprot:CCA24118.1 conserved hypothetical protein [Albugo laibachii Nc14]